MKLNKDKGAPILEQTGEGVSNDTLLEGLITKLGPPKLA